MTRPTTVRVRHLAVAAAGLALVAGCAGSPSEPETSGTTEPAGSPETVDVASTDLGQYARALYEETNEVRDGQDLPPLERSSCAREQARQRAQALVGAEELTHAPMGGVQDACGVTYSAENLVRSEAGPAAVVEAWMGSSGHRMNLLSTDATRLGVACVVDHQEILCSQVYLGPPG